MSTRPILVALLIAASLTVIATGASITYLAHKAASRTESRSMRLFSYGFAAITAGLFGGALGALLFGLGSRETLLVQGLFVVPGFLLLVRSLYTLSRVTHVQEG